MSLKAGDKLGPYEILALLGTGGMGEVYCSRDTTLDREVAIKILPPSFAADADRLARFEREAKVLASLNHPNIAHVYGVEEGALVMELVAGESPAGPMLFEDAWKIATQIADALEYAHEKGVIHRDLKPANVKVTPEGVVKLLDFGLAKALSPEPGESQAEARVADSPTLTIGATAAGVILGTAAYMAPEQAKGKRADRRADIWSWGVMLYELLTGERLFQGENTAETLAAVIHKQPELDRTPARVRKLLARCLEKNPRQRLRDIGEARFLLEDSAMPAAAPSPSLLGMLGVAAAVFAVTAAVASLGWWRATRPVEPSMIRIGSDIGMAGGIGFGRTASGIDPETQLRVGQPGNVFALSSDGTRMAAGILDHDGRIRLAIRSLDQSGFVPIPGTENLTSPFFSPDGQWVAFFADRKLKKVPVQGGAPAILCDSGVFPTGSWGDDGNIIAALNVSGPLSRVPSAGGAPAPVTDPVKGDIAYRYPQVLPGAQAVLFTAYRGPNDHAIEMLSLKTRERKILVHDGEEGRYVATSKGAGYVLYRHENTLLAAHFELARLALSGTPQLVLNDLSQMSLRGLFDVSNNGTLVYLTGGDEPPRSIFWLDSAGNAQPLHAAPGFYNSLRFSPDGKRLAFAAGDPSGDEGIWVVDLDRDTPVRLTSLPGNNIVWTSDSKYIIFNSSTQPNPGTYCTRADGSGEPERLRESGALPSSFSPGDQRLAFFQFRRGFAADILTAPFQGDADHPRLGQLELFLNTPPGPAQLPTWALPKFSPDGHWIVYSSGETGVSEVYVNAFPSGEKTRISNNYGGYPIWSSNGRELFFIASDRRINVVGYTTKGGSFMPSKPRPWSQQQILLAVTAGPLQPYDLGPDGKRFAVLLYPHKTAEQPASAHLIFLLNFLPELRRRVPTNK